MSWDDIEHYQYTHNGSSKDWGWEFIRRDGRYKEEWDIALARFHEGVSRRQVLMFALLAEDVSSYSDSASFMDGTVNISNPEDVDDFCIPSDEAGKWGLRCYQNPKSKKLNPKSIQPVKSLYISSQIRQNQDAVSVSATENSIIAVLDLTKPLSAQLSELDRVAKNLQAELLNNSNWQVRRRSEKVSKRDQSLWISYLRLLDAKAMGIERKIAAPRIFGGVLPTPGKKWDDVSSQIKTMAKQHYRQFMG